PSSASLQGGKEDPAQCKEPKFLAKAGWMKKGYGRLLASYKDRFVHVEKTEIVVYENEELQNCLEKVDLESYDKCHELKSPFKRKHRLILIRSPKSANKVHDVKFQTQTAEEKEAWIKALSDGINRAKNKIFDEVKVDDSSNLEHVTRTRPKGNRNRRPPTRIHMKEVCVCDDGRQSPSAEGQVSEDKSGEADNEPQEPSEPLAKSPPLVPKKKPEKPAQPDEGEDSSALLQNAPDTSAGSSPAEETPPKSEVPTVVVSVKDPVADSLSLSPLLCHFPGEKKKKAEEKSVDSGQHSDDDSESSVSEDTLAASTAALRGSNAGLDVLDANEDDAPISVTLRHPKVAPKPQVGSKAFPLRRSEPTPPLKPSAKARSASIGDLLSVSSEVGKLEAEVALEIEKTRELLSRVSIKGGDGESMSEDLLTKAMEKLKTADHVLREVKKLTPSRLSCK
uniref:Pleckstrin homology domain containing, family O member 2 n=1 Tax=Labrus bergylta TaxID=56723 RepID=A0A3Q3FFS1_9LABR